MFDVKIAKYVLLIVFVAFTSCEKQTYEFSDAENALINYDVGELFKMQKLPQGDTLSFEVLNKESYTKEQSYYYSPDSYSSHCDIELGSENILIEMRYVKAMDGFSLNVIVTESDKGEVWYSYEPDDEAVSDNSRIVNSVSYNDLLIIPSGNDTLYFSSLMGIVRFSFDDSIYELIN